MSAPIFPLPSSGREFHRCWMSDDLVKGVGIEAEKNPDTWMSVRAKELKSCILVRKCVYGRTEDVSDVVRCDLRVREIFPPEVVGGRGVKERNVGEADMKMLLAEHIAKLEGASASSMDNWARLSVCRDDIEILQPTRVKAMTVIVVLEEESESADVNALTNQCEMRTGLREKIRDVLTVQGIGVRAGTVVDLRECPLSGTRFLCPRILYLLVSECVPKEVSQPGGRIGEVTVATEITVKDVGHVTSYVHLYESAQSSSAHFVGLESYLKFVEDLIRIQAVKSVKEKQTHTGHLGTSLLIAAPPGCGKALIVREAAKKLKNNLFILDAATNSNDDISRFFTTSSRVFSQAETSARNKPTVLLLQHLDQLCHGRLEKVSAKMRGKLISHLCQLLDAIPSNISLTVIATANSTHGIPQPFRRPGRLQNEIYIKLPTESERENIISSLFRVSSSFVHVNTASLAQRTPGFSRYDLEQLVHVITLRSKEAGATQVDEVHIRYGLSHVVPFSVRGSVGLFDMQRTTSLDDIAGLHSVKLDLIKAIVWPLKYSAAFTTMGIHPPRGILLYGPPGCAKTTLVRAVAGLHQTNFLSVTAAELFCSGVGDSEKLVADLFHRARLASPCILFVDELEALLGSRKTRTKGANESVLTAFLTEMDGVGVPTELQHSSKHHLKGPSVIVVAATNRIDLIDSAFLRPGRIDRIIAVPPPSQADRTELLRKCLAGVRLSPDVNLEEVAAVTNMYSGADLVNLCKEAALLAMTEDMDSDSLSREHLMKAKDQSSPSLSSNSLKQFQEYSRHL